jgi:hypothetical protein
MKRAIRILALTGALVAVSAASVATASATGRTVFSSTMVGLPSAHLVVAGVTGAGAPWEINEGSATLTADGRLHVEVQGLTLLNGTNPVTLGKAVVSCNGVIADSTETVPFSSQGNAQVNAMVSLPSTCFAPAVFFTSPSGGWFAVTGL